ncbi:OLC1v1020575C1 [Oldenlandia corymbosa var. corymbosa]|uniref:OLC1v1020575C1 n=1 Tax=Oldenlandia corymbosa var. corymbosa TaxID=529605 RepID=A0AAV1EGR7_OLDCO|nr:OLC1v1020575C1 [Oldenlandia corymbosa var. corymbosa]
MAEIQAINFFFQFCLIILAIIIFFFLLLRLRVLLFSQRQPGRLPPSTLGLPIIGHLHLLRKAPHEVLHNLSKRLGPLIYLRIGSVPWVVACSPEIAKEFLKTHDIPFCNRPISIVLDSLTYGSQDFASAPYGPYWKFMRKMCMSELLGGKTLDLLHPVRRDEITRFAAMLSRKAMTCEAVEVSAEIIRLTNNVVSRMATGERCFGEENGSGDIKNLIQEIAVINGKFNLSDHIWFLKKFDLQGYKKRSKDVRERFDKLIEKIIKEHEEARMMKLKETQVKDLLDILLDISEDETSPVKLSRDNIKASLMTIFQAGTGTSSITLEWALSELINHPDIMRKAMQEIDTVVGNERLVDESDIKNLPYLQAIVKETLRLHPAAPMMRRESSEDCEIGGYHIPARTRLFVNIWSIGRDPSYWENPLQFLPERFLEREQAEKGKTTCSVDCFEWKIGTSEGNVGDPLLDMEAKTGHTLFRAKSLICFPVARHNPLPIPK